MEVAKDIIMFDTEQVVGIRQLRQYIEFIGDTLGYGPGFVAVNDK